MQVTSIEIETALKLLAATPRRLASASKGLENTRLHLKPDHDSWSANDILAHLRACADVWGKSISAMLAQDHPTLRYLSPRTWIRKTNYLELEFDASLLAFAKQRKELVQTLNALAHKDWSRGATFTASTKGREHTVFSYARRIAQHENEHCEQIAAVLKRT
jgi:hypothetical protein